jgi:hypothetical protein
MAPRKTNYRDAPPGAARPRGTTKRVDFPDGVQAAVLLRSARRCALCFGLDGLLDRVDGQIAHLDRNNSNVDLVNAAYLCLPHHNEYDSWPSQSKRFMRTELIAYRNKLYTAINKGQHVEETPRRSLPPPALVNNPSPEAHDRALFHAYDDALPEETLVSLLQLINTDQPFDGASLDRCSAFVRRAGLSSNQFVTAELQQRLEAFADALHGLWVFIELKGSRGEDGRRTAKFVPKPVPHQAKSDGVLYVEHVDKLNPRSAAVSQTYAAYRKAVKQALFV